MKTIYTKVAAVALALPVMLTGCIEETLPTSGVTAEQVGENSKGIDAIVQGMPAYMKRYHLWGEYSFNFGYPSFFLQMNVQTQDVIQSPTGYDWFAFWAEVSKNLNSTGLMSQTNWYYLNFMVKAANDVLTAIPNPETDAQKNAVAQAYIYRASTYLDMARVYEFLPNDKISGVNEAGNDVTGLTVPINTPDMSDEQLSNNPRLTHEQMLEFLVDGLNKAIALYTETGTSPSEKVYPSLAVAYGILARVYMWDENYTEAAKYAKLAYQTSGANPLTRDQWLSKTQGFNDSSLSSWMWSIQYESNDDPVQDYDNWASFQASEANVGYTGGQNTYFMIDKSLYDRIDDDDFRKLTFKAPKGHPLSGLEPVLNKERFDAMQDYASIKFRPGQGNVSDMSVAFAVAVPLMRVEEMYFIEAEALAHTNAAQGKQAIVDFMTRYRYPSYSFVGTGMNEVVEEIVLQKRIEFWGEGVAFFDFKRLDMEVDRAYNGSNWPDTQRFRTSRRPGWMNWPFVDYEGEFNLGVRGYLNPNVGDQWKPVINAD